MPTLHWIGKDKVVTHHLDVPFRVLNHRYVYPAPSTDASLENGNLLIKGDNLEALKALLPYYEGRIKCIYIDPPYNTGNEGWIYNDNVNDPKIKRWLGKVVGKEAEDLTRHDKWLCMMYPRLQLLHKLLADDGAIFVSIDDNEQANLKLMMDEIWGAGNFVINVAWNKVYSSRMDSKGFSKDVECILVYSKSSTFQVKKVFFEQNVKQFNLFDDALQKYYRRRQWRKEGSGSNREDRPNLFYPILTPDGTEIYPIRPDNTEGRWRGNLAYFEELKAKGLVEFVKDKNGENQIFIKQVLEIEASKPPSSFWANDEVGHTHEAIEVIKSIFNEKIFDTPKPPRLIERILQIATNPNDIILDSFAGSGTTAHAVLNLNKQDGGNRKFILVEMEDYAERITAERIRRVIDGYGTTEGTGGSFSYYELGEPLFNEDQQLNENLSVAQLRDYIWYTETRSPLPPANTSNEGYFMGKHYDTAYYFVYEKDQITTLDYEFLATVEVKAASYVIYADNCLLPRDFMAKHHLIFKKIPRDISRF